MLVMKNVMFGNCGAGLCACAGAINTLNASINEPPMAAPVATVEKTNRRREIPCMATLLENRRRFCGTNACAWAAAQTKVR